MGVFEFAAIAVVSMSGASMWKAWVKSRASRRDEALESRLLAMETNMMELESMRNEMLLGGRVQVLEELAGRNSLSPAAGQPPLLPAAQPAQN